MLHSRNSLFMKSNHASDVIYGLIFPSNVYPMYLDSVIGIFLYMESNIPTLDLNYLPTHMDIRSNDDLIDINLAVYSPNSCIKLLLMQTKHFSCCCLTFKLSAGETLSGTGRSGVSELLHCRLHLQLFLMCPGAVQMGLTIPQT